MPDERFGPGLKNWEYGLLCEEMGRSPIAAPMAFNCSAPDTGNMEILAEHGSQAQQERWLEPLLEGRIRSCFSMTEPEVSGSDPTLLRGRAVLDGDEWVIDAHKWYTSGAVGAELATGKGQRYKLEAHFPTLAAEAVDALEAEVHHLEATVGLPDGFVIPGGNPGAAAIDLARTLVRRAERRAVTISRSGELENPEVIRYLNRLSDLLFMLARKEEGERTIAK